MNIIEMNAITKDYPLGNTTVNALRGITLDIPEGDLISIIGPSGSGKTTLLNIIGCIDTPTSGSIRAFGKDVTRLNDNELTDIRLFKIGFIFQTFNLIPVFNTLENVEFPLMLMKKYTKKQITEQAETLIEAVGLKDQRYQKPAELSGGQRQRVAIARSLVTGPDIVLADEPTANLDSETGASILELMKKMNQEKKTTFIFSTHDPDVMKYANHTIKIKDGLLTNDSFEK